MLQYLFLALKPLHDRFGLEESFRDHLAGFIWCWLSRSIKFRYSCQCHSIHISGGTKNCTRNTKNIRIIKLKHIERPSFTVDATCTRVHTLNGHMAAVSCRFSTKPSSVEEVIQTLKEYPNPIANLIYQPRPN